MRLSGIEDEQAYKVANNICIKLGQFFQIQDDYLDCYGDPKVIGKIGTDIKDNKCGWLVVQALKKCTAEQRKIIEENYGKDDAECEKRIKKLYGIGVGEVVFGVRGEELQGVDGYHGRSVGVAEGVVFEHVGEDLQKNKVGEMFDVDMI